MNFVSIDLCHKYKIENIRKKYGHKLSSHAFSSLYLWQEKMQLKIYLEDEIFCIKFNKAGENDYYFPCGSQDEKIKFITSLKDNKFVIFHNLRKEDILFLNEFYPGQFNFKCL